MSVTVYTYDNPWPLASPYRSEAYGDGEKGVGFGDTPETAKAAALTDLLSNTEQKEEQPSDEPARLLAVLRPAAGPLPCLGA